MYGLYPVPLHDSGNTVSAAYFTDFTKIAVNPAITVDSAAQCISIADELQQPLIILFSGRNRAMKPDVNPARATFRTRHIVTIDQISR